MYVDWETVVNAARVISSVGVIAGLLVGIYKFVVQDKRQQVDHGHQAGADADLRGHCGMPEGPEGAGLQRPGDGGAEEDGGPSEQRGARNVKRGSGQSGVWRVESVVSG